jgi:hypothetical protein
VLRVHAILVRYPKPKPHAKGSRIVEATEAVEILVETSAPFPVGAYGPVLYVGDVPLSESERLGERIYRFFGYEPTELEEGAPISVGWFGQDEKGRRTTTGHRFKLEPGTGQTD